MREGISSYFNYTILFVVVLLFSGFVAIAMNYTKAYRMKNGILSNLERYSGNVSDSAFLEEIKKGANNLGYKATSDMMNSVPNSYTCVTDQGWCYKKSSYKKNSQGIKYYTIDIIVFINFDIPIIREVMPKRFFSMSGTTSSIPDLG